MIFKAKVQFLGKSEKMGKNNKNYIKYMFFQAESASTLEVVTTESYPMVAGQVYDVTFEYNSQYSNFKIKEIRGDK